jgi:homocitrate synthase NifV
MAVGNSSAAPAAGAQAASVAVNGLGERTGNAAWEAVGMAAHVAVHLDCGVDRLRLSFASRLAAQASNRPTPGNKPIVGSAAFRHGSGIHCAGLAAGQRTDEPSPPEEVGHHPGAKQLIREMGRHNLRLSPHVLRTQATVCKHA